MKYSIQLKTKERSIPLFASKNNILYLGTKEDALKLRDIICKRKEFFLKDDFEVSIVEIDSEFEFKEKLDTYLYICKLFSKLS